MPFNVRTVASAALWTLAVGAVAAACSTEKLAPTGALGNPPCTTDPDCQFGKYCSATGCIADCGVGLPACAAGKECSQNGRCVDPLPPAAGGTAGTSSSGGTGGGFVVPIPDAGPPDVIEEVDACAETSVDLTTETPNVLLLVDRSGSMSGDLTADVSRWTAVRNALVDPTAGLVPLVHTQVNLGLALYTGPDRGSVGLESTLETTDPDYIETDVCPYLVSVPVAPSNAPAITAAYVPQEIRPMSTGQTPTGESIEAALPALTTLDPVLYPGPRVLVLATDGEPDLCEDGDDEEGGRDRSVAAITAAFDAGITTYVISVGDDVGEDHLRELANIGQGFPADDTTNRFYNAADSASLAQAFEDIVNGVRSCTFALDGMVTGDGAEGTVTVDGTVLVQNDLNGWRLNGPSEVEILGTTCETLKSGEHSIDVRFPCDVIEPIPK
jgi:hypothetical protein